jgi:hypothetical protein
MNAVRSVVRALYNRTLRPHLPQKIGVYNGVAVRKPRLFDLNDVVPGWEAELISHIEAQVESGDDIVVVGGGFGISSVVAAHQTGQEGSVIAYEAAAERYRKATETVKLNDVGEIVNLRHTLVGPDVAVKGTLSGASTVNPSNLPRCDVLILDCEGAETKIIDQLSFRPRVLVIETHSCFDAPTSEVRSLVEELGYDEITVTPDNLEYGIDILVAKGSQSLTESNTERNAVAPETGGDAGK